LENDLAGGDLLRAWTIWEIASDPVPLEGKFIEAVRDLGRQERPKTLRLATAAAIQRLPLASRWDILDALTSHREDAADHNLPLMYWYAMEPLAEVDPPRALALGLSAGERIPILKEYMIRRIGAGDPASRVIVESRVIEFGNGGSACSLRLSSGETSTPRLARHRHLVWLAIGNEPADPADPPSRLFNGWPSINCML
jgi:hypothetical protein